MDLTVRIPDELATRLGTNPAELERKALEGLVLEAYRHGAITRRELRKTLGFEVLDEVDGFLKAHGLYESYSDRDLEGERRTLDQLGL